MATVVDKTVVSGMVYTLFFWGCINYHKIPPYQSNVVTLVKIPFFFIIQKKNSFDLEEYNLFDR